MIHYQQGSYLQQQAYFDACADLIDAAEQTIALGGALDVRGVGPYLTPICHDCDRAVVEMTQRQREVEHRIYKGYVVIGCEGYWEINPRLEGIYGPEAEESANWMDWVLGDQFEIGDDREGEDDDS